MGSLNDGTVADQFNAWVKRIATDIKERPHLPKIRKVSLDVRFKVVNDEGINQLIISPKVTGKLPDYDGAPSIALVGDDRKILFNDVTDDVDQAGIDEEIERASRKTTPKMPKNGKIAVAK